MGPNPILMFSVSVHILHHCKWVSFCILFLLINFEFYSEKCSCVDLQHHFFVVLRHILEGRPEVSELHSIEGAKVPLMRFKFNGILVDFPYVQLPVINAAEVSIVVSRWCLFTILYYMCYICSFHRICISSFLRTSFPCPSCNIMFSFWSRYAFA